MKKLAKYILALLVILMSVITVSCVGGDMKNREYIVSALDNLGKKAIFFGHQSVGRNILSGIYYVSNGLDKSIKIEEYNPNQENVLELGIIHQNIGENEYPSTKISDFQTFFSNNQENLPDIALMKFCYVDTYRDNSPEEIYKEYVSTMETLEKQYPETTFVYVTMPLTSPMDKGIKNWAKNILGRLKKVDTGTVENIPRNIFNTLLRDSKSGTGRLFDLAEIESTTPDGKEYYAEANGKMVPALYPLYTWDGGHLNEEGQKLVASELIKFLAGLEK